MQANMHDIVELLKQLDQETILRMYVEALNRLEHARDQADAEAAVISAAPFLWAAIFARLTEQQKERLRKALTSIEKKYGDFNYLFENTVK